jgi:beta-carotene 3-hydroxylase
MEFFESDFFYISLWVVFFFAAMDISSHWIHKYLFHGILWKWHESHHIPRKGWFEKNDIFPLIFSIPTMLSLIFGGSLPDPWSNMVLGFGFGVCLYGSIYFVIHDYVAHKRIKALPKLRRFLERRFGTIVYGHRVHHQLSTKDGQGPYALFLGAKQALDKKSYRNKDPLT